MGSILLSFVIPCYRSEHTIEKVIKEIIDVVGQREGYDYEIIAVNDASPDRVYTILHRLASDNHKIKIINLAKNMGKHAAVLAGYSVVRGRFIVNLDDDHQCPVYELWKLADPVMHDECDIATAQYYSKKELLWKRMGSRVNMIVSEIMLKKPKGLRFENFSVIKRFVCDQAVLYKNPYPFLEGLFLQVTDRVMTVAMENRNRADDNTTGFTFWKSFSLFVNGMTSFSVKPLRMATMIGSLFSVGGFLYGSYIVIRRLIDSEVTVGYSSVMAVLLFSSGLIMLMLGLIGEYVGRIFICINNAPQYVIRNTVNIQDDGTYREDTM